MDPFQVEKQALRADPIYIRACQTGPVMGRYPADWFLRKRWEWKRDSWRLNEAALRMDHLIRGALLCSTPEGMMTSHQMAALDGFIEHIEKTMPSMSVITPEARQNIEPRIAFARKMLALHERERVHYGFDRLQGNHWFENFVIGRGFTMRDIVFHDPFYALYSSPGRFSGVATLNLQLRTFHTSMRTFWQ